MFHNNYQIAYLSNHQTRVYDTVTYHTPSIVVQLILFTKKS